MKATLFSLFLILCSCYTQAQVTSSKKNAQTEIPVESAKSVVSENNNSTTVVSGARKAVIQEVSLETKGATENTSSVKTETASLLRKPE